MRSRFSWSLLPVVLALAGVAGILLATPHGIGLSPDSISYVAGSRNIVDGKGFTMPPSGEPITHFLPFYPFLLATIATIGPEPAQAARWLAAVLFGVNITLIWQLASRTRGEIGSAPAWMAAGVAGLALTAPTMWGIHLMALTEPAYISLSLLGVWLTATFVRDQARPCLIADGACIGLAVVTRYAGLSMWGACCLALLVFGRGTLARRVVDVVVFSALALGPFVLWVGRNLLVAETATSRSITFHPIGMDHLREALANAASWVLVPEQASGWTKVAVIGAVGAVIVAGICLRFRKTGDTTARRFVHALPDVVKVALIAAVVYPLFLVFSVSFVDANTPLDQRILSPLFVLLLIFTAFGLHSWDEAFGTRLAGRWLAALSICLVCVAYWGSSYPLVASSHRQGLGFNDLRWTGSKLVQELKRMSLSTAVYSNSPDAVYYHAGRGARRIPRPFSPVTRSPNPDYGQDLAAMSGDLDRGGVLVYLERTTAAADSGVKTLIRELGLVPLRSYPDGTVYASPRGAPGVIHRDP